MKRLLYIGNKLAVYGFTSTSIETLGTFLEGEGFHIFYASSRRNRYMRMCEMIFKTIRYAKKVDYVLIDTYSTKNFWYAVIISQICRVLNVKYIPELHGGDLPNRIEKSRYFANLVFKNAYINVAPSNYLFQVFKNCGYINLKYIPNSIDFQLYKETVKEFKTPKILWVRSFSKIYNPIMAIKVFIRVRRLYPDSELCMVGPRKDDSYFETKHFARKNNVDVVMTGKLSKEDWIELSKDYNVFINTTHFDNTPISVMEAMALGIPIVSTNVGGIPYMLEHNSNALLVNDNDVEDMANQINRLMKDPNLANTLSYKARETVKDFDWEIVKKQWTELLI